MNNAQAQQFAALQKATAVYNNETKTADHMRRREVDLMNREQERLRLLEEELRAAHGALGEETRTQKNLEVERTRYRKATEADRQAIVKITSEMQGTEAEEKEEKIQFVKEMETLTNESDYLLARREDSQTSALLDSEQVIWLVESKLGALTSRSDGVEGEGGNEKWAEVTAGVKEELAGMAEDDSREEAAREENNELEPFLQQLRAKVLSENSGWGQMEIEDIENKWDGQQITEERGENVADANGSKQQEPVHIGLFYNNQEYGMGPVYDSNSVNNIGQAV